MRSKAAAANPAAWRIFVLYGMIFPLNCVPGKNSRGLVDEGRTRGFVYMKGHGVFKIAGEGAFGLDIASGY